MLDRDEVARAIVRMAHEIVERNARRGDSPLAIVGIHRRGVHLADRLHAQVCELLEEPVALGSLDIAFHRDDLGRRAAGAGRARDDDRLRARRRDGRDRR